MRGRFLRFLATAAVVGLGMAALGQRAAVAQQPVTVPMSVTENREPGLAGQATITPLGGGRYRVDIRVTGLPANDADRPAHIHTAPGAQCDNGAPITYPLTSLKVDANRVGTSTTEITVTADKPVTAGNAYVNVHNPAQGGRGVFCGNLTTSLAGPSALPATGDGSYEDEPEDLGE